MRSVLVRYVLPILFFPLLASAKMQWTQVAPEDLAATTSKTGADIEMLHVRTVLDSSGGKDWVDSTIEAKVYTKKGVENMSILHITYTRKESIWDVAARVVKQNGTTVELTKKDFIESSAVKKSDLDVRETSFAFPGVEPGDVVQYHWKSGQTKSTFSISYQWYYCQQEVPVRLYEFSVLKTSSDLQVIPFNCPNIELKNPNNSEILIKIKDLPAFVEERDMPPQRDFRSWICLVYTDKFLRLYSNNDAWEAIGNQTAEQFRFDIAASDEMKAKARELTADAKTPEEKLARLNAYCQSEYINFDWVKNSATMEDRKKRDELEDTQSAKTTFKKRDGDGWDIDRLFAALAKSLKFEVRLAESVSRDDLTQIRTPKGFIFLNRISVAVKVGDKWQFYTPSDYLGQVALLSSEYEGALMFITDEDKSWFQSAPTAGADKTQITRTAKFSLDSDGTLEGDVEVKLTGHAAVRLKKKWWGEPREDALKDMQDEITNRISGAEITDYKITNLDSLEMPVKIQYHIKATGYAEATGTRLILMPEFFEIGNTSPFNGDVRRYPILFPYASTTNDEIVVTLPEGYTLDSPSAPRNVGKPADIIEAQYTVAFHPKARTLTFRRTKVIGADGSILFNKESFPIMKGVFEAMDRSDHHNFILKPVTAAAATTPAPAATAPQK